MLIQLIELPWMEVGHQIAIVAKCPTTEPAIQAERKIMAGKPEKRESYPRCHRGGDL
jgi:hypothetical protein